MVAASGAAEVACVAPAFRVGRFPVVVNVVVPFFSTSATVVDPAGATREEMSHPVIVMVRPVRLYHLGPSSADTVPVPENVYVGTAASAARPARSAVSIATTAS